MGRKQMTKLVTQSAKAILAILAARTTSKAEKAFKTLARTCNKAALKAGVTAIMPLATKAGVEALKAQARQLKRRCEKLLQQNVIKKPVKKSCRAPSAKCVAQLGVVAAVAVGLHQYGIIGRRRRLPAVQ